MQCVSKEDDARAFVQNLELNFYNLQEDKTASSNKIAVFNIQQYLIYDDFQILLDYYLGHDWRWYTHTARRGSLIHNCTLLLISESD